MKPVRVAVVGTFAVGVTLRSSRLPAFGETLHAEGLAVGYGGKGSNQAVACARLGAEVQLATCVGPDAFGDRNEGVGTRWTKTGSLPTGLGVIVVEPGGRNAILVDIGANREMDERFVDERAALLDGADVLLTVTEAPLAAVRRSIELASSRGIPTVLNPAPAVPLDQSLLSRVTVLTPNASEVAALTGREARSLDSAAAAARELLRRGARNVVVTLGEDGALACSSERTVHVPAIAVRVVDTTGAGDAFSAGLTVAMAEGRSLVDAVKFAVRCGSLACTAAEVIPSLPRRADVERSV